jgi:hypothetical protein
MEIASGFHKAAPAFIDKFRPYCHDAPCVMSVGRYRSLKALGRVMQKAITAMVLKHDEYADLMPMSERDRQVMRLCEPYPFRLGTFRTDFVIDQNNAVKIIEMTTRQPLNGYIISGFSRVLGLERAAALKLDGLVDDYPRFLDYLGRHFGDVRHVCVIRGYERMGDFKIYPDIFKAAGYECHIILPEEVSAKLDLLTDAAVIEELNHAEIRNMTDREIEAITAAGVLNDFRNLFVAHDKRFFGVMSNPRFQSQELTSGERELLSEYLVPTYLPGHDRHHWQDAYANKNCWILKARLFGKGEKIFAGELTEQTVWKRLFDDGEVGNMVLQPFLKQRRFKGRIGQEERDDFIAGTLLYFNDEFFGPGIYRASSCPVTNLGDDRKIAQLVADIPPGREDVYRLD